MEYGLIKDTTLQGMADSLRAKGFVSDTKVTPEDMVEAINNAGALPPESAFSFTGDLGYKFCGGTWDWFLRDNGHKITTSNITTLNYAFEQSKLTEIPFVINVSDISNFNSCFRNTVLTVCPKIRGTIKMNASLDLSSLLHNCNSLADVEDLFDASMLDGYSAIKVTSTYSVPKAMRFEYCHGLRRLPSWWYKFKLCEESTAFPTATYGIYYNMFIQCDVLDEALDIPVWCCEGAATSNLFTSSFSNLYHAKDITFETDNGQPIVAKWKSQTVDLATVGRAGSSSVISYGLPVEKEIKDDATYQAFKDDIDAWSANWDYSRYNHDSAVRTINSLPDTSAYLASAGGTNTVRFKGTAGSKTDAGAVNTLTAEEIAVATAKGWTVTFA